MRAAFFAMATATLAIATPAAAQTALQPPDLVGETPPKALPPKPAAAPPALPRKGTSDARPPALDAWEATRLPWYAPSTLAYQEGMPLPPGYTLLRRRPHPLLTAGLALFGTSYLASALTAATVIGSHARHRSEVAPLFAPLAGPWITLGTSRDAALSDPDRRANGVLVMIDGVAQLTGAALIVAGIVLREPVLTRTRESYGTQTTSLVPELVIGPRSAGMILRF